MDDLAHDLIRTQKREGCEVVELMFDAVGWLGVSAVELAGLAHRAQRLTVGCLLGPVSAAG
jgi:hypothetical protein